MLKKLLVLSTLTLTMGACSSVRVVNLTKEGGELALLGDRHDAMEKAELEMAAKCGGRERFEIVEQGEVVVGSVTQSRSRVQSRRGRRHTTGFASSTSTTQDKTEWRVIFQCLSADPAEVAEQHVVSVPFAL